MTQLQSDYAYAIAVLLRPIAPDTRLAMGDIKGINALAAIFAARTAAK